MDAKTLYEEGRQYLEKSLDKLKKVKIIRKPTWLQWSWFPKDGQPPTQSVFEILIYSILFLLAYNLFLDFNKVIYNTISIDADKINFSRHITRVTEGDTTYYLHYQSADLNLQIPRSLASKADTISVYSGKVSEDSMQIKDLNRISSEDLHESGLTPYWRAVFDYMAPQSPYQPQSNLLKLNHIKYDTDNLRGDIIKLCDNNHNYNRFFDDLWTGMDNPKKRYYFGLSSNVISTNNITRKDTLWHITTTKDQHIYRERSRIKKGGNDLFYMEMESAAASIGPEIFSFDVYNSSDINNYVSIQPPGWFERFDISQGWYKIRLNTSTIDSITLTIDFVGATDFYPMKIEPDEKGSNYIRFTNPYKILQIRKDGLSFYAKFVELENRQTIRCFAVTAVLSGLLIVLLTFFILGFYRGLRAIRKSK